MVAFDKEDLADLDSDFARVVRLTAVVGGIIAVILGLILLLWPNETILVVTALLGLSLLFSGVFGLWRALFAPRDADAGSRVLPAVGALITIAVGALCVRHLTNSAALLAAIVGVVWLVSGVAEVFGAIRARESGAVRWTVLAIGIVSILGGLSLLIWPNISLVTLAVLVGLWLIVGGVAQIVAALRIHPPTGPTAAAVVVG